MISNPNFILSMREISSLNKPFTLLLTLTLYLICGSVWLTHVAAILTNCAMLCQWCLSPVFNLIILCCFLTICVMQANCVDISKKDKRVRRRWRTKSVSKDTKIQLQVQFLLFLPSHCYILLKHWRIHQYREVKWRKRFNCF